MPLRSSNSCALSMLSLSKVTLPAAKDLTNRPKVFQERIDAMNTVLINLQSCLRQGAYLFNSGGKPSLNRATANMSW